MVGILGIIELSGTESSVSCGWQLLRRDPVSEP